MIQKENLKKHPATAIKERNLKGKIYDFDTLFFLE